METIHGIIKSGDEIDVPMEDILHVEVKRVDAVHTGASVVMAGFLTFLVVFVAMGIALATGAVKPSGF